MCFDGGESISQSATSSPDLFDETRTDGKGSLEWEMSVGLGSIMVELLKMHLLEIIDGTKSLSKLSDS